MGRNEAAGNLPSQELLAIARHAILPLAIASVLGLYAVGRVLGGPLTGAIAARVALASPMAGYFLLHAWDEVPFVLALPSSLWLSVLLVRRMAAGERTWPIVLSAYGLMTGARRLHPTERAHATPRVWTRSFRSVGGAAT